MWNIFSPDCHVTTVSQTNLNVGRMLYSFTWQSVPLCENHLVPLFFVLIIQSNKYFGMYIKAVVLSTCIACMLSSVLVELISLWHLSKNSVFSKRMSSIFWILFSLSSLANRSFCYMLPLLIIPFVIALKKNDVVYYYMDIEVYLFIC